jgi:hypothetical protein
MSRHARTDRRREAGRGDPNGPRSRLDGGNNLDTCIGDDYYTSTFVSCDVAYKKY